MENKLRDIIASVLNVDSKLINNDSSSDTLDAWDSLNHMNLIMSIEEEFEVSFEEEEIIDMTSFKSLLEFLEKNT